MWPDGYNKHSFFHMFHTCHLTTEQKNRVFGTFLDCLQYHHKVTKTYQAIP